MTLPKSLNIVIYSDVHLGNRRVCAEKTAESLMEDIEKDLLELGHIDMIIISGDLFDRHLPLQHPATYQSIWLLGAMTRFCQKHGTLLRILEGTPSHDWNQGRVIDAIKAPLNDQVNVRYVDELSIEDIPSMGISILYLPDEWSSGPEEAWLEVSELLATQNRDTVSIVVMHGLFEYQLPKGITAPYHVLPRYQSIVDYMIYCGHVHTPSSRNKLQVPGSYTRISHGEEHPKGHLRTHITTAGTVSTLFVENMNADIFKTIETSDMSLSDFHDIMEELGESIPEGSNLRVICTRSDGVVYNEKSLMENYPRYNWKVDYSDKVKHQMATLSESSSAYHAVPITPTTIIDMTRKLALELGHDQVLVDGVMEVLNGYVNP